jgi:hypothetical protein
LYQTSTKGPGNSGAFLVCSVPMASMRKPAPLPVAARKAALPGGHADRASVNLVCLALALALLALAARIASIW